MKTKPIAISFVGNSEFLEGLSALQTQLGFVLDEGGARVEATQTAAAEITVESDGEDVKITYFDKASLYRAFSLGLQALAAGGKRQMRVKPTVKNMGSMQNCSTTVIAVETVKELVRQHALMGYNYLQLYTETTYEIEGEPYFGYQKGRYTAEELKELVAYGKIFGVELVPCIQTLAHLSDLFKWGAYGAIHDVRDTLLVDHDRTYDLIEKMLKTLSECFDTARINLGMDEGYFMGTGRYNWFMDGSKPDVSMLFIKHLKRVLTLAEKYGFTKPSIWFDNLFGINYKGYIDPPVWLWSDFSKEIRENFPKVQMIYWNYVIRDLFDFKRQIGYIRQLSPDVSFASMAHGYTSFAPETATSEKLVDTAREGCLSCGIDEFMVTWWGSKITPFALLPALYSFAEGMAVGEGVDKEARCKLLFGYDYQEFRRLDAPNLVGGEQSGLKVAEGNNLPFYALANDPLCRILDRHIPDGAEKEFAELAKELETLAKKESPYAYIFDFESTLCKTLSVRAELGKKLKAAYDEGDRIALKGLSEEIPKIAAQIRAFHKAYRKYFLSYAKSQGVEYWDNALGGSAYRLETVKEILDSYLAGETDRIPELEQTALPISAAKDGKVIGFGAWNAAASNY